MTIVAAWTNKSGELLVASDSLLTGGGNWDCCPKVFPMLRGDAVLAFAGSTLWAYPLVMQANRWADDFEQARSRAYSLESVQAHLENQINALMRRIGTGGMKGSATPPQAECTILLAGYSIKRRRPRIWVSRFIKGESRMALVEERGLGGVVFVGDVRGKASEMLNRTLRIRRSRSEVKLLEATSGLPPKAKVAWEPLDIICAMSRSAEFDSVGGPPQVVKVSKYLSTMAYAVNWTNGTTTETSLLGRPLLPYERTQRLMLDPDTHQVMRTWDYLDEPTRLRSQDAHVEASAPDSIPANDGAAGV